MEQITSKDNKRLKEYVKLSNSKSYRDECALFTVESVKLILEAYHCGIGVEEVFVTDLCLQKYAHELEKLVQSVPCSCITNELSAKLSLQNTPQGIYAICKKPSQTLTVQQIISGGNYVMLVGLQDAGNVGTMIRTAEALGMQGVIITIDTCDIYNPKVLRGSMGSVLRMPFLLTDDPLCLLNELAEGQVKRYASTLDTNAVPLGKLTFTSPAVLLIGNEGNGLNEEIKKRCSEKVMIQMAGNTESLNASMAACILMWEMTK